MLLSLSFNNECPLIRDRAAVERTMINDPRVEIRSIDGMPS